ncbi:MAG TPA: NAD(P)/FAD-dependent oxidoreductase [Burkholderiaceae bacterium]|nr:NAD(P)/FAD-dependent oxidoreductase [Burkholderiaceae bacterium]
MNAPTSGAALAALEARLREDLSRLELPARRWTVPRQHGGQPVADVVIVGAGMAGLTAAAALKFLGIEAVLLDRAPAGFEGPWATTARMETLRSPKQLTGPALGMASLTFRAWFEACFGAAAWAELDKIDRLHWMEYLRWYRRVLELPVRNGHTVQAIEPQADRRVVLRVAHAGKVFELAASRVVLATGRDGLGSPWVPDFARTIPRTRWAHSADLMDYRTLRGQRVAVVGGGSSAMDVAATALEAGAASVDLLVRRADLPRINKGKGAGSPGMTHGYQDLPDAWKWRIRHYLNRQQTPPPHGSTLRVSRHPNARFHLGCPVLEAGEHQGALHLRTPKGICVADFVLFSTGFRMNFDARPEFAALAPHLRLWGDRYQAAPGEADDELSELPDLGPVFEFTEKSPGACPGLSRVHCFCYPAVLSHGAVTGDIPAISEGAQRLAQGLASLLFRENIEAHFAAMERYADPELLGDEWQPSDSSHFLPLS